MKVVTPRVSWRVRKELDGRIRGMDGRAGERVKAALDGLTNHTVRLGKAGGCRLLDILEATANMRGAAKSLAAVRRQLLRTLANEACGADSRPVLDSQAQLPSLSDVANDLASVDLVLSGSVALLAALAATSSERLECLGSEAAAAVARCLGERDVEVLQPDGLRELAVLAVALGASPDPNFNSTPK